MFVGGERRGPRNDFEAGLLARPESQSSQRRGRVSARGKKERSFTERKKDPGIGMRGERLSLGQRGEEFEKRISPSRKSRSSGYG